MRGVRLAAGIPVVPERGTPSERLRRVDRRRRRAGAVGQHGRLGHRPTARGRRTIARPGSAGGGPRQQAVLQQNDVHVGDLIDAVVLTSGSDDLIVAASADQGQPIRLTVTGIGVLFDEVVPDSGLSESGSVIATAPLGALVDQANRNSKAPGSTSSRAPTWTRSAAEIEALGQHEELGTGGPVFLGRSGALARRAARRHAARWQCRWPSPPSPSASSPCSSSARQCRGPAGSRRVEIEALRPSARSLVDRVALTLARAAIIGTSERSAPVVVAVAMSGVFPIGVARVAEPDPGIRVDGLTLAIGAEAIIVLTVCSAVPAAVLGRDRRAPSTARPSRLAGAAAAGGPVGRRDPRRALRRERYAHPASPDAQHTFRHDGSDLLGPRRGHLRRQPAWPCSTHRADTGRDGSRMVEPSSGRRRSRGSWTGSRPIRTSLASPLATTATSRWNGLPVPAFDLKVLRGDVTVGIIEGGPADNDRRSRAGKRDVRPTRPGDRRHRRRRMREMALVRCG